MNTRPENSFDHQILTRLFPLACSLLLVYIPYSFLVSGDRLAGWLELLVLAILLVTRITYYRFGQFRLTKDLLIFLGFPVLIPWLLSGGPGGHTLWWSPVYVLWVSFFATGWRFFVWLGAFVLVVFLLVVASKKMGFPIGYEIPELLHILFAFIISMALIYYYELWRTHYRQQSEAEFEARIASQERYRTLLESAPDAVIIANQEGRIVMTNLQAETIFGYPREELIGSPLSMLIPERLGGGHLSFVTDYFKSPRVIHHHGGERFFAQRKDGSEFPIELSLSLNEKEKLATAVVRDVTRRNQMTDLLVKQNAQLNDFAHIASHNIRGPVGNLRTLVNLIRDEQDPACHELLLDKAGTVIQNLEETLNDLLEIASIRHYAKQLNEVSFEKVMLKIMQSYDAQIMETRATVTTDFTGLPHIHYSPVYLESILENLLSNALKYRSPERAPKIRIETLSENGQAVMLVSDNGIGIDLEKYGHKVFGLHETFHPNPAAKGVGLYLVKSQVETLGGAITVNSTPGEGSTFKVVFAAAV